MTDNQTQRELVEFADIAVRTASQLRLYKSGRSFSDPESLQQALEFIGSAKTGGKFMSRSAQFRGGSLRPLNWATDTYFETLNRKAGTNEESLRNFDAVVKYLDGIESTLGSLIQGKTPTTPNIDELILFFEILGEALGTRADQRTRRASTPFGFGEHAAHS